MKARKKMTPQLLIDGVVTAVNKHFPPDVKEIKKRMESLIEREVSRIQPEWLPNPGAERSLLTFPAPP